jgi:hypothetical protein
MEPILSPGPSHAPVAPFLTGAGLALVTSGGLLEERLSPGSAQWGFVVNTLVTVAAVGLLVLAQRGSATHGTQGGRMAQAAGAAVGILVVHAALRLGWVADAPWLTERPLQLVNDAVAVFATLGVVWACAEEAIDLGLFAVAITVVILYRATGRLWHLDLPPQGFRVPVQTLVMAQVAAAALAVALYRTAVAPRN